MKVVILAGGLPSTLIEEDEKIPKPMAEIGRRPVLWHIMKQYAHYGFNDFIICTGYKGNMIKDYIMNFYIYQSDITVDMQTNNVEIHRKKTEDWNVSIVDTGINSSIVQRIIMIREYLKDEPFLVTYGDCVSDINIRCLVKHHQKSGKLATYAVARPTGRNEILPVNAGGRIDAEHIGSYKNDAWVSACSMVFEPQIFRYLNDGDFLMGKEMLRKLSQIDGAEVYRHEGFWSPMETARDKAMLERLWNQGKATWKVWGSQ